MHTSCAHQPTHTFRQKASNRLRATQSMTDWRQYCSSFGVLKNDLVACHNALAAAMLEQMAGNVAHEPPKRTLQ